MLDIPYLLEYKSQLQHLFLLLLSRGASYTPNITSYTPDNYMYGYFMQYVLGLRLMLQCDIYIHSSKYGNNTIMHYYILHICRYDLIDTNLDSR